ncbi:hypothetical protein DIPPA_16481 [Diplonema papillatum]|nr:hypothetical protein DIPPA_16481 [Diplonema papillatum]
MPGGYLPSQDAGSVFTGPKPGEKHFPVPTGAVKPLEREQIPIEVRTVFSAAGKDLYAIARVNKISHKKKPAVRTACVIRDMLLVCELEGTVKHSYNLRDVSHVFHRRLEGGMAEFMLAIQGESSFVFQGTWDFVHKISNVRYGLTRVPLPLTEVPTAEEMHARRIYNKPRSDTHQKTLELAKTSGRRRAHVVPEAVNPADVVIQLDYLDQEMGVDLTNSLRVVNVAPMRPADKAGMGRYLGQKITHICNVPVTSREELKQFLDRYGSATISMNLVEAAPPIAPGEEEITIRKRPGERLGLIVNTDLTVAASDDPADRAGGQDFVGRTVVAMGGRKVSTFDDVRAFGQCTEVVVRFAPDPQKQLPAPAASELNATQSLPPGARKHAALLAASPTDLAPPPPPPPVESPFSMSRAPSSHPASSCAHLSPRGSARGGRDEYGGANSPAIAHIADIMQQLVERQTATENALRSVLAGGASPVPNGVHARNSPVPGGYNRAVFGVYSDSDSEEEASAAWVQPMFGSATPANGSSPPTFRTHCPMSKDVRQAARLSPTAPSHRFENLSGYSANAPSGLRRSFR